ncbi:hypothetical protein BEN47_17050 [Hymenobacter lapidarius]|uniref:Heavy metal binding domain-containing protein n=1 Tax=Hymenobacter lapidarius TaxID=1908237 RepID=A0A1G1SZA8_9BACT|nr:hypothetical protein BEN47_17050 [Hymenobacter lapidarius]
MTLTAATTLLLSSCDNKATTKTTTDTTTMTTAPADSSMMASPDGMMAGDYTCEMHPEVHSDHPGKCPKCGMNLTKTTAAK